MNMAAESARELVAILREIAPTAHGISADSRRIAIDKVGIKDIRHPVRIRDRNEGEQPTVATFNMYVYLPHNFKGTHMSRFVEILNGYEREISVENFETMLREMVVRLEAAQEGAAPARFIEGEVLVLIEGETYAARVQPDGTGLLRVRGLSAGTVRIAVMAGGYEGRQRVVTLAPEGVVALEVTLPALR